MRFNEVLEPVSRNVWKCDFVWAGVEKTFLQIEQNEKKFEFSREAKGALKVGQLG